MSQRPITLADEIADLRRELKMRQQVYPNQLLGVTDPRKRAEIKEQGEHRRRAPALPWLA